MLLKKGDFLYLEDDFFVVKDGQILIRYVLENGKVIVDEYYFGKGEIIGNFISMLNHKLAIPEIEIEMEALEDSKLEMIKFPYDELGENEILKKSFETLVKTFVEKLLFEIYDTSGYIMSVFKYYANERGEVSKKQLKYEYFKIGKSQYYLILAKLKYAGYFVEADKIITLNMEKVDKYLENYTRDLDDFE